MCTRFSFAIPREIMKRQFTINIKDSELQYSYNIGAGQGAYVMTNKSQDLQVFRWGLIPHWAQKEHVGLNFTTALGETIATQDTFRMAARQRRCLVFADSYYEWQRNGLKTQPFRITLQDQRVMVFAGVWEEWEDMAGHLFQTFAIVTTPAPEAMKIFGLRSPVILDNTAQQQTWLHAENLTDALSVLQPYSAQKLSYYPIHPDLEYLEFNSALVHTPYDIPLDHKRLWVYL